jgi:hypothetical protein
VSATREWSREDLAHQDCRTGATDAPQSAQEFSLPLDRGILRIGSVAFLLDDAKLAFDQLKTLVFPFKFAAQALAKRSALSSGRLAKINSCAPPLRLDPPDALSEEQAFDAVDMASALSDQALALSGGTASIFLFDCGHSNDGAHVALTTDLDRTPDRSRDARCSQSTR